MKVSLETAGVPCLPFLGELSWGRQWGKLRGASNQVLTLVICFAEHPDLKTFSNVMQVVSTEIMTTLYHLMKSQHTPPAIGEIEHSC